VNPNPAASFDKDVPGGILHISDGRTALGRSATWSATTPTPGPPTTLLSRT